jgi:membrane-bound lytic murein transglycosylase F
MALASYNIGYGHLEDARVLTEKQSGNPDRWIDVKERLPLLVKKKWYKQTKYGYARGNEPVSYIANVRQYIKMLKQLEPTEVKPENNLQTDGALKMQLPAL